MPWQENILNALYVLNIENNAFEKYQAQEQKDKIFSPACFYYSPESLKAKARIQLHDYQCGRIKQNKNIPYRPDILYVHEFI
jgi:hypothetical protein